MSNDDHARRPILLSRPVSDAHREQLLATEIAAVHVRLRWAADLLGDLTFRGIKQLVRLSENIGHQFDERWVRVPTLRFAVLQSFDKIR